jgi:CheY-like chemotaxis protein
MNRGIYIPGGVMYEPVVIFTNDQFKNNKEAKEESLRASSSLSSKLLDVLFADDDLDDRELFKEAIESAELRLNLDFVEDGKSLFENLQQRKTMPDLIFLDLNMPFRTGKECLVEIRKDSRFSSIPVIIYSTSSSIKDIDDTFEKGANLYVKKPSSFKDLITIAKKVMSLDWNKYRPHSLRNQFLFSSKTE